MGKVRVKIKAAVAKAKATLKKKGTHVPKVQLNMHINYQNGEKGK